MYRDWSWHWLTDSYIIVRIFFSLKKLKQFIYNKNTLIFAECDKGRYGQNCSNNCGFCSNKEQCDVINGTCMNGCDIGYWGDYCTQCKKHCLSLIKIKIKQFFLSNCMNPLKYYFTIKIIVCINNTINNKKKIFLDKYWEHDLKYGRVLSILHILAVLF